jgi:PAS domain S-box-containing protein
VNGTQLRVAVSSPLVRRTLDVAGLNRVVSTYPSVEAALAARAPQSAIPDHRAPGSDKPGPAVITPAVLLGLIEALADGILLVTGDGLLALVNRRAEDMFGYPHGELAGQRVEALIPVDLRAAHADHRAEYGRRPTARPMSTRRLLVGLRKDGTTFPARISLSPVPTASGHLTLAVIRDITGISPSADLADLARRAAAAQQSRSLEFLNRIVDNLYHIGLRLQQAEGLLHDQAVQHIAGALQQLDDTIAQIRDHVFAGPGTSPGTPPPNGSG